MFSKLFTDPEAPATVLNVAMINEFGVECYFWDPETLREEISHLYSLTPDEIVLDKIQAISTINVCDSVYHYFEIFESIGCAFNDQKVFFETSTPLDSREVCWAILEIMINDPSPKSFGIDVEAYINAVFHSDGLLFNPEIIKRYYDSYRPKDSSLAHMREDPEVSRLQGEKKEEINSYFREKMKKLDMYFKKYFYRSTPYEIMQLARS